MGPIKHTHVHAVEMIEAKKYEQLTSCTLQIDTRTGAGRRCRRTKQAQARDGVSMSNDDENKCSIDFSQWCRCVADVIALARFIN